MTREHRERLIEKALQLREEIRSLQGELEGGMGTSTLQRQILGLAITRAASASGDLLVLATALGYPSTLVEGGATEDGGRGE
jgi:hypothetical protein